MKVFVRPYPQAVSGNVVSYSYDVDKALFTMEYIQDSAGESTICAPFTINELTLDSAEIPYKKENSAVSVISGKGRHTLNIRFERK